MSEPYGVTPPGFRLPDATHVGAVHLQVSNLQRSLSYYEEVLGLRARGVTERSATLHPHEDERPVITLQTRPGISAARRGAFGLYHFAVLLPDRAALGRFAAHLAASEIRVGMADHLVSEALYLWDPDGLGIEVYADRPRDTWKRHGGELAMTTDPLDMQSVIASAGGESWTGMPKGTTMGHVHLHVGTIEQAEAFYHRALGFDKTVWTYSGALFMSAGGYHHHLGTNIWSRGPAAGPDQARLLEWELILPPGDGLDTAARSLQAAGHPVEPAEGGVRTADPWGTRVRLANATAAG
jgi:catechol 2,3-dioxygenase